MTLKPWREVITPHRDVMEGRFQASEFAADLSKVTAGTAGAEYQDPELFFERTYITEGMGLLLDSVVRRLAGQAGDPVIRLQTAFGGGKTHSMLAAYHVARGDHDVKKFAGLKKILDRAKIKSIPKGNVAVLDGNALAPSQPRKHGAVQARTLWGEMAWQLGKKDGFDLVAAADRDGTSPGKEDMASLFERFGPCVILMDEMVAYVRQFEPGKSYAGGTFESNMSFMQALTEAVSIVPTAVLLASLPESDMEVGGQRGKEALGRLEHVFGRKEALWKPVATEEGFEIVRRRLFGKVQDEAARDEICRAFADLYLEGQIAYPKETQDSGYYDRLICSYPIHPEVFARLYEDWATLESFQRTRGVLRFMAMVIHRLWSDGNADQMILPGSLPLYDTQVRNELLRYLPQGWEPVIERDVDGPGAGTTKFDEANPLLGSVQAARKVARTVFLGSAPSVSAQKVRGVNGERVRLGCVQPGQQAGRFDDALRHLTEGLHYLYAGKDRYWYDTRPNLRREMEERAGRYDRDKDLIPELSKRLRVIFKGGSFGGVHVFATASDVPDDSEIRFVVLPPHQSHKRKTPGSLAVRASADILKSRGNQPRLNQNRLVFVAADDDATESLWKEVRTYLAWASIVNDKAMLNLDQYQTKEAEQGMSEADVRIKGAIRETFKWVLAPAQEAKASGGLSAISWEEKSISSGADDVLAAIRKALEEAELLIPRWSPIHLKKVLDDWFWKPDVPAVKLQDLWDAFCRYPYLQRLQSRETFVNTIAEGIRTEDFFGYAAGEKDGKYQGLLFGQAGSVYLDASSLVIEPKVAVAAKSTVKKAVESYPDTKPGEGGVQPGDGAGGKYTPGGVQPPKPQKASRRFHGRITLSYVNVGLDAAKVADEVIQHFTSQIGNTVKVTLEVEAEVPRGIQDNLRRTIQENCKTLKFDLAEFEEE